MDKLSFAAVYRPAAILAAFSQASAECEASRRAPYASVDPSAANLPRGFGASLNGLLVAQLKQWMMALRSKGRTRAERRWSAYDRPSQAFHLADPVRDTPLVSHFAFCRTVLHLEQSLPPPQT